MEGTREIYYNYENFLLKNQLISYRYLLMKG